ncbi:MAG: phosphodiester glycosidase family protein [Pseudomonadota bacterium]
MTGTYQSLWASFTAEAEIGDRWLGVLDAFDDGDETPAPGDGTFPGLEGAQAATLDALPDEIARRLADEVDPGQAAMFARRFQAVVALLDRLSATRPEARLLRSGLVTRADGILHAPPPLALRIRSLVDFYYSNAAVLHHQERLASAGQTPRPLAALMEAAPWQKVSPGLFHRRIAGDGPQGPVHVNALRFDPRRFTFRTMDLLEQGRSKEPFGEVARDAGAIAAISGGFFLYSEHDIEPPCQRYDPVGMLVSAGAVRWPPVFRRGAFLQDARGHCHIREVSLAGTVIRGAADLLVAAVNPRIRRVEAPTAFTRVWSTTVLHPGPSLTFYRGTVTSRGDGGAHPIPLNGFVLCLPDRPEWRGLADAFPVGSEVTYLLPDHGGAAPIRDAVAAGPVLVRGGHRVLDLEGEDFVPGVPPATFSGDETSDRNLLPRLAAGLTANHDVVFAAVDGRNFGAALGMTLRDTARLMVALGCVDAVNLDGGSSKRMVLQGQVLDLATTEVVGQDAPQDEQPTRPVHTGLFVFDESMDNGS